MTKKSTIIKIAVAFVVLYFHQIHAQQLNGTETRNISYETKNLQRGNGLNFTQNKGQIADMSGNLRPDVLYYGDGAGADIYLRKAGVSYVYTNMNEVMSEIDEQCERAEKQNTNNTAKNEYEIKSELIQKRNIKVHRVDMDFLNFNSGVTTFSESENEGFLNFYYANCPNGVNKVKQYDKVICKNIYNNIEVSYYNDGRSGLKYDIIVNPHANPDQIKLRWTGAENIHINQEGNLVIKTSVNEFYESIPKVYQIISGKVIDVNAQYNLTPALSKGEGIVSFELDAWNPEFPLIIDPSTWITYYGGNNYDGGISVATDGLGNAIFSGYTQSVNFPVSTGAYQVALSGTLNAYIVKMNSAGGRVFGTYFGGSQNEIAHGIDADLNNDIFVTGITSSANFPTKAWGGAYLQSGGTGAFVAKFSPTGALIWSTQYTNCTGYDINTDMNGNIIVTGSTRSTSFSTQAPFQAGLAGAEDAFIVKFNNAGVRLWATYYGGLSNDWGYGVSIDAANNIFICGSTSSLNFPAIAAFQGTMGGVDDAFLARLDPTTGFPVWSTYYGGTQSDQGAAIATDALGNVFIETYAWSANAISTGGAYQTVRKGMTDVALIKFTNTGSRVWGTYLGGNNVEEPGGIAVDANNNIIVAGDTYGTDFPVTSCAYQKTFAGTEDQFISTFNQQGNLICSGYLGIGNSTSPDNETAYSMGGAPGGCIAVTGGYLYMTAFTSCTYPVTAGAFQTLCGGTTDAAFSKLCIYSCGLPNTLANFTSPTTVCANNPVNFTLTNTSCDISATTYLWTFTGGTPGTSTAINPTGIKWSTPGSYGVSVKVMSPCDTITINKPNHITINNCSCTMSATSTVTSGISCSAGGTGSVNVTINNGSGGPYTYNWSTGISGVTTAASIPLTGLVAGTYNVTITDGACISVSAVTLTQPLTINSIAAVNPTCNGGNNGSATVSITGSGGSYTYSWSNGVNSITNALTSQISNLTPNTYTVTVTQGSCSSTSTTTITQPFPMVTGVSTKFSCSTNAGTAIATAGNGTPPYTYTWSNLQTTQTVTGLATGNYTVTVKDMNGCTATRTSVITKTVPTFTLSTTNGICGNGGSATANVTNGTGPFTYSWSNTTQTNNNPTGLPAGNYTVLVTDANECTSSQTFAITSTPKTAVATFTQSPAGTVCTGTLINFTNTGTPPGTGITYQWVITPSTPVISGTTTNFSHTFITAGTYSVRLQVGSSTCSDIITSPITVINCSSSPTVVASGNSVCPGSCATITSSGTGGVSPYTYSWSNGATPQNINPCPASTTTYTVTIKDSGGNTSTSTAVATIYPALNATTSAANIACNGGTDGTAIANPGGGTSPYTYSWNNGSTTSVISNLTSQVYTVTITDSKSCTATSSASISSPPPLSGQFTKGTAGCTGCGCKEWIMATAAGGTSPYSYLWPDGYVNRYKNQLCPGSYSINIKDRNGCSVNVNFITP